MRTSAYPLPRPHAHSIFIPAAGRCCPPSVNLHCPSPAHCTQRVHFRCCSHGTGQCGCCYAFAATGLVGDRQCLADAKAGTAAAALAADPERYMLSPTDLVACGSPLKTAGGECLSDTMLTYAGGCTGYTVSLGLQYAADHGFLQRKPGCASKYPYVGHSDPTVQQKCEFKPRNGAGPTIFMDLNSGQRWEPFVPEADVVLARDLEDCQHPENIAGVEAISWNAGDFRVAWSSP